MKGSSRTRTPCAEALGLAVRGTCIAVASTQLACLMACPLPLDCITQGTSFSSRWLPLILLAPCVNW